MFHGTENVAYDGKRQNASLQSNTYMNDLPATINDIKKDNYKENYESFGDLSADDI